MICNQLRKLLTKSCGISGSLRNDSTNTALIRIAGELAPSDRIASIEIVNYKTCPLYDGDIESTTGIPDVVKEIG